MKRNETQSKRNGRNIFSKVFDSRNRQVRGLWIRNGIYYAQMRHAEHRHPIKLKLDAKTVPQAIEAMQVLKKQRRDGELVVEKTKGTSDFNTLADGYISELEQLESKRPATIKRESSSILSLKRFFNNKPVSSITMADAFAYSKWRKSHPTRQGMETVSGRAIDVDIVALRNLMKKAVRDGLRKIQPIGEWKPLADPPKEVRLVPTDELEMMREKARTVLIDGQQFSDYLGVLAFSGGREQETLRLRWSVNIDFKGWRIGFGQDGLSKFGKSRWLPMNPQLKALLIDLYFRSPASDLVFPSPRGGNVITSYKKSLARVKLVCGIEDFGFHHLRHYFISNCLMSGVDVKTIADWVGHEDIKLISDIYGHLTDQHSIKQAEKVQFSR